MRAVQRTSRAVALGLVALCALIPPEVVHIPYASADSLQDGLIAHWPLRGDCRDASGNGVHGHNHGADLTAAGPSGEPNGAARCDGRASYVSVPACDALRLETCDFTLGAWVKLEEGVDDVIGDIASMFDPVTRRGLNLSVVTHTAMTSSTANCRNLHFGIDDGAEPVWHDCGRPGEAVFITAMAVHDGALHVGTYEYGADRTGHVYRYEADGQWTDLGSPDGANAVMTLAPFSGELYAGTANYHARGSALPDSPNTTPGGHVYRYLGGTEWADCGRLAEAHDVYALTAFRGQLWAIPMYTPGVFQWDGGVGWSHRGTPGENRSMALCVWNGELYATGNGGAGVWRYLDGQRWEDCGRQGEETQTYAMVIHCGQLYAGTWPAGKVWQYQGDTRWRDCGRLGEEKEVMAMGLLNGKLYCGTLPLGQVYRYDAEASKQPWTLVGEIDSTPDVTYRRVWTMAVYRGQLFAGTLPSGHVWRMEAGPMATIDRALAPGWHHIVAAREGDRLKLYVDGSLAAQSATFDPARYDLTTDQPLRLGFGAHDYLHGSLSDVRLYGRALSAGEVGELSLRR